MFLNPFQTTACSALELAKKSIQPALQRAAIHGDLLPSEMTTGTRFENVFLLPPTVTDIKPFAFPIEFDHQGHLCVAVDVRGYTRSQEGGTLKIVAGTEYDGQILRAALMYLWMTNPRAPSDMRRWGDISGKVFIRLLSEALIRRLNLGPADQQAVQAISGMFYFCGFMSNSHVTRNDIALRDEREQMAIAVSRMTRIPVDIIMGIYNTEGLEVPFNLDDYCKALRVAVKNPRLDNVDAATIITLLGGVWYGADARRLVACALEYPPFWLSMIYQALTDRSFHNSLLAKTCEQENRNRSGDMFVREMASYLEIMKQ